MLMTVVTKTNTRALTLQYKIGLQKLGGNQLQKVITKLQQTHGLAMDIP